MDKPRNNSIYEFEDFHLDAVHLLLYQNGRQISLAPKVVETLLALVEHCGEVLSKDELMEIVWADSIVEEGNLSQNLYLLRKILNETADGKPLIETLKRRGYRFNGDVLCVEPETAKNFSPDNNQSAAPEISINNHHSGVERQGSVPASADRKINEPGKSETGDYHFQISEPADAFQACQLARIHYQRLTPPDLIKSRVLLEKAIRLDAGYAPAYVAFAEQSITEAMVGSRAPAECFAGAKDAIARASELNANSAEFYAAAGYADLVCDWNFTEAGRNLRKSLEINSHHAYGNNYLGQVFMFQRRFDEAETYLRRARKIEPTNLYHRSALMISFFLARNYQKLIEESEKTLALYPQFINAAQMRCWALEQTGRAAEAVAEYEKILLEPHGEFARRWIGYAYALVGDEENARATAAKLAAESREHYVSPIYLAMLYAGLNESDESCFYLEKAAAERDPWLLWIAADPRFDNLRSESRFQNLEKLVAPASFRYHFENVHQTNGFSAPGILPSEAGDDFAERTKNRLHLVSLAKRENTLSVRLKTNKTLRLSAAICAAVLLFGAFFLWQKWRTDSRFKKIELKALTTSGEIRNAAISPDGKLLVYAKNESGRQSLWISQTQFRESEMRLTEPTAEATFAGLSFTPDGNKIYFLLALKNNSVKQLAAISTLGGQPTVILDDVDSASAFSPDGRRFAFMRGNSKTGVSTLFIANADGSDLRELARREPPINFKLPPLAWSPDGKKIACAVFDRNLLSSVRIVEINAETGAENVIYDQIWNDVHAISWTKDEAGLIFTASEPQKPLSSQIWFLPYANRTAHRLTNDLVNYGNVSVARSSGEIIIRQLQRETQVWLLDAKLPSAAPRRITPNNSDGEHGLAWTPDNRLIYSSAINGSNGLQKMSIQDSSATSLTTAEYVFSQPCATADNRYVVYVSAQAGHYYLWRVDADGKNIKQLTSDNIEHPTCSPADASRVFYTTATDGKISLREISIDGGEPRLVSEKTIVFPQISPDGNRIACFYRTDAKAAWQIAIMPTDEDRILQTFDLPKTVRLSLPFVWSKDGGGLILIDTRDGIANLWRYSLDGQAPVQITNFADGSLPNINYLAVSSDGSQIALTRMRTISDIVQIDDKQTLTAH